MSRPGRVARVSSVLLGLVLATSLVLGHQSEDHAAAQQRRVVVLGDSVVLGAQGPMTAAFAARGWEVTFDAAVSRSTAAAVEALEAHRPVLTDSLVLSFGANDAGNPATFRQRAERLLDAAASVPNVYWLTIREVRDYYGPANQVLREVAAARPNVTVIDWHAATAGNGTLTASDGLHLNGSGAALMSELVVGAVVDGAAPPAPPPPPPPPPPPSPSAPPPEPVVETTAPPAPTDAPVTASTVAPSTAPTTAAPTTTSAPVTRSTAQLDEQAGAFDSVETIGATLGGGLALIVALLAMCGIGLAAWSLAAARRRAGAPPPSEHHPAVRSQLRAERIAAAAEQAEIHHAETQQKDAHQS